VATDPNDVRKRAESLLNKGAFGSGPFGQFMGLGLQFVLAILLFLYVGKWVDGKLGTTPWLMITGVFTGAGAAFYSMYRALKAAERRQEELDRLEKEGK
jgi:F0F1-type ATP synthase assembly protein I